MHSSCTQFSLSGFSSNQISAEYEYWEQSFTELALTPDLDRVLAEEPELVSGIEAAIENAIARAYGGINKHDYGEHQSHLFLQRILYRINRLCLFWYDDLENYTNERSLYLQKLRNQIENIWQEWELSLLHWDNLPQLDVEDVQQGLKERVKRDLNPEISPESAFLREEMSLIGYKHLLAIASLDGLVEGSRLSRILAGVANPVMCTLVKVLLEEYGNGRYQRKHSTFYAQMLAELGMSTQPEAYLDLVPWEVLACANHNFFTTERKREYLTYCGALTFFEVAGPASYRDYLTAARRLNLSEAALGYWDLHIREDERHGQWMLEDVALPLADMYPEQAWEILLGYDREKFMGQRATTAIVKSIRITEILAEQV